MKLKNQDSAYPLLATLKKLGKPLTRENYLALDGWDNLTPDLTAKEELDLPPQFRRSSHPSEESAVDKPEVMAKDERANVTVTYTRLVLTSKQHAAHDWNLANWPRCQHDDFFDMCLTCITHRQLTNLLQ
jgi:hypothetical protein